MTKIKTCIFNTCILGLQVFCKENKCLASYITCEGIVLKCLVILFSFQTSGTAHMLILAVMHKSIYCVVYIMNEEELLVQICGLHKESMGIMGKRALWNCFFIIVLSVELLVVFVCCLSNVLFCKMKSLAREIKVRVRYKCILTNRREKC